jgi:spore coat polysaccharide biosynthesis protein SpsF
MNETQQLDPSDTDKNIRPLTIRVFIQARMSSIRFPGKVLAPFNGQPIIKRVISRVAQIVPAEQITVATSTEQSDDPLASYVQQIGISVYRGPLENVFQRFRLCLREYPCSWFFRVCADSPLLDSNLFKTMLPYANDDRTDLVTNVQVRTFPRGCSLEMINAATFARIDPDELQPDEKEHLTKVFYNHPEDFEITNIESGDPELAKVSWAVDTLDDLLRLERTARPEQASQEQVPGLACSPA